MSAAGEHIGTNGGRVERLAIALALAVLMLLSSAPCSKARGFERRRVAEPKIGGSDNSQLPDPGDTQGLDRRPSSPALKGGGQRDDAAYDDFGLRPEHDRSGLFLYDPFLDPAMPMPKPGSFDPSEISREEQRELRREQAEEDEYLDPPVEAVEAVEASQVPSALKQLPSGVAPDAAPNLKSGDVPSPLSEGADYLNEGE